jgi:hypothetical protein
LTVLCIIIFLAFCLAAFLWLSTEQRLQKAMSCYERYRNIDVSIVQCINEGVQPISTCLGLWNTKVEIDSGGNCP